MSPRKRTGLAPSLTLERTATTAVIAAYQQPSPTEALQTLPLSAIAHDPDNPGSRHDMDPEMVASIREVGVLQPISVVPLEVWLANRPDHAEALSGDGVTHIAWVGNRRVTNARAAGLEVIPAVVRTDVDGLTQSTGRIHENQIRRGLSPVEEAVSLRVALDQTPGLTQRALASHLGTSEPRVSKLLRLLDLPSKIQELVDAHDVPLEQALALTREGPDVLAAVAALVDERPDDAAAVDLPRLVATARHQHSDGAPGSEDVPHPLSTKVEATPPKESSPAHGGDTSSSPATGPDSPERPEHGANAAEPATVTQESTAPSPGAEAAGRRVESLCLITASAASEGEMVSAVAAAWVRGSRWGSPQRALVKDLLAGAGLPELAAAYETSAWAAAVAGLSRRKSLHVGWILALAVQETRAAGASSWGAEDVAYLRFLSERGYQPTDDELALMEGDLT